MVHELKGDVCFPCLGGCVVTLRAATHEVGSSNKTILCNLCFVAELIQRSHFAKLNYPDHCQFEPQMDVWSRVI